MRATSSVRLAFAAATIALLAVAGCAPSAEPSQAPPSLTVPKPGLETLPGGTNVAFGWIEEVDVEGGTWLLRDQPPDSSTEASIVVVLVPGTVSTEQFDAMRGRFVRVQGPLREGPSTRMAGPEMSVESIDEIGTEAVNP